MPLTRILADAHIDFVFPLEPGTIAAVLALIVRPSWRSWGVGCGSAKTDQTD